ncbi:MAG: GNAT family N-acetyltransferase [candidate division Zixibacteria bacterium]|nr:GNAT family N-acetyltransferase [candidate division Zixibacteria bacterium]
MIRLETERLVVRQPELGDAQAILDYVTRNRDFFRPWEPMREDEYYTLPYWERRVDLLLAEQEQGRQLDFFVFPKDSPERVIGKATFSGMIRFAFQACYLGYSMDVGAQGMGYMTEALRAAIDYLFNEENFHRIMANYQVTNAPSAAVLKKLGFVIEGTAKAYLLIDGEWQDHVMTSLTNPNWKPEPRR